MRNVRQLPILLLIALTLVASLTPPLSSPVSAQEPSGPVVKELASRGRPSPRSDDRTGPREPGPAPDVSVWIPEGERRSVRGDGTVLESVGVVPGADEFTPHVVVEPDLSDPTNPTAVDLEVVQPGFVPGESVYRGAEDSGRRHVWDNPDGTITVAYSEYPVTIDEDTGKPVGESDGLKLDGSGRFGHEANGVEVSPLTSMEAREVLAGPRLRGVRSVSRPRSRLSSGRWMVRHSVSMSLARLRLTVSAETTGRWCSATCWRVWTRS